MTAQPPGSTARTRTAEETRQETRTASRAVSYLITQSEAVAWYIREDLQCFVESQRVDLGEVLGLPAGHAYANVELIELLCDDIAHLLRDGLVSQVHLLLHDPALDASTGAYPLVYKATYEIALQRGLRTERPQRRGGLLSPPDFAAGQFAIVITWAREADAERRQRVSYPRYNLNWVPPDRRYDRTTLVRYRDGSMTADGATIVARAEDAAPGVLQYLERS